MVAFLHTTGPTWPLAMKNIRKFDEMAEAARQCLLADKNFVKGYFRLAVAQKALDDLPNCIKTLKSGLAVIQSLNANLKRMKKEVTELQRAERRYCGSHENIGVGQLPRCRKSQY
jgi:hypothetical protein